MSRQMLNEDGHWVPYKKGIHGGMIKDDASRVRPILMNSKGKKKIGTTTHSRKGKRPFAAMGGTGIALN